MNVREYNFSVYTGYVARDLDGNKYANLNSQNFFNLWYKNTRKYIPNKDIFLLGPDVPDLSLTQNVKILGKYANLGHIGDYLTNIKTGRWCGWTAAVVLGLAHSYAAGTDFIYKEQDCLSFGNYIERMYNDCKDHDIVYGSCSAMGVAQSLFLVKRDAIPDIIASLSKDEDRDVLPEYKFTRLPVRQKRLSFGYDRDRPFNESDDCFYIQQLSTQDIEKLNNKALI